MTYNRLILYPICAKGGIYIMEDRRGRKRKLTPDEEERVYEQRVKGVSVTEVAYNNGISTKTVQRIVNRFKKESNVSSSN